jgi:predicted dithiol-disulfide oxidoreductase (DUF899 family)
MLLKKEKEFTMLWEQLSKELCNLPWVASDKEYACSAIRRAKADKLRSFTFV